MVYSNESPITRSERADWFPKAKGCGAIGVLEVTKNLTQFPDQLVDTFSNELNQFLLHRGILTIE